jgi:3-methylcrotonyl-CoA carboxylase alpha subunit
VDDGPPMTVASEAALVYRADDGSAACRVFVAGAGEWRQVFVNGETYDLVVGAETTARGRGARSAADQLSAPMPARIAAIAVSPGESVRKGDVLLTLDAMKMQMVVRAPRDGTVTKVACRVGELVQPGIPLVEMA